MQDIRQSALQPTSLDGPVVITGAAGGIGFEVARLAAAAGAPVALLDRDAARLGEAECLLSKSGRRATFHHVDVSDEDEVEDAFARIAEELGPLGGLVTSAGVERVGAVAEVRTETFDEVIATNLRGTFLCSRAAVAQMLEAGVAGSIVCISSTFALTAGPRTPVYSASKAAIGALVRSLAVDYGAHGIRANTLLPGPTDTELMWSNVDPSEREATRKTISSEVPLGRLADPSEPAAAALWLLSGDASFVTGAEIACDGGVLAKSAVSA